MSRVMSRAMRHRQARHRWPRIGVPLALLLVGGTLQAQGSAATGVTVESYHFQAADRVGLRSVTLQTLPLAWQAKFSARLTVEGQATYARGQAITTDGAATQLQGLTDTQLQFHVQLVPDRVTFTLAGALPTGIATHDAAQATVAGVVAADLIPFRIAAWGTGGGLGGQLAMTQRFGQNGFGLSAGWRRAGDFQPASDERFVYRPGPEAFVRLAVDRDLAAGGKLTLSLSAQQFGDDQVDGRNLFRSGARVSGLGSYAFPLRTGGTAAVYGGVLHRTAGTFFDAAQGTAMSQDLLLAGGLLRHRVRTGVLTPRVDMRLFRSADGIGQGYLAGAGVGYEWRTTRADVTPLLAMRAGRVMVREGQSSGITGLETGLTIRFGRGG